MSNPIKPMTLEMRLRAADVKRWHIVRTRAQQSVAEHSFNVAILARHMLDEFFTTYDLRNMMGALTVDHMLVSMARFRVQELALNHDLLEVLTGDIPSPFKKWFSKNVDHALEDNYNIPVCPLLHEKPSTGNLLLDDICTFFVKVADSMEAHWWITNHGAGPHAKVVAERLSQLFQMENIRRWGGDLWVAFDEKTTHGQRNDYAEGKVDWYWFFHKISADMCQTPREICDV